MRSDATAQAELRVAAAVFAFDPAPTAPPARALRLLTVDRDLPSGGVRPGESVEDAVRRLASAAGAAGRERAWTGGTGRFDLVGVVETLGRHRIMTVGYLGAAAMGKPTGPGVWSPVGRAPRVGAPHRALLDAAIQRLRGETRSIAGAAWLLGEVFTADDLLRVHIAIHGAPEGSERTFRRRIQELRDRGVLRAVPSRDVAGLRERVTRFRSPSGTGGRPPALLRYRGGRGDDRDLAGLRSRPRD